MKVAWEFILSELVAYKLVVCEKCMYTNVK